MATWRSGQAWRVVNSLNILNQQIRAYAPRALPPATRVESWGSIADGAHSTTSDHYPHFYGALGATAVVCARDFPHAPALGLDGGSVTEAIRIARPAACQYVIFNRRITGVSYGWAWHAYTGDDPHDTHFHVSTVRDARADSTAPWPLPGAPAPVTGDRELDATETKKLDDVHYTLTTGPFGAEHVRWASAMPKLDAIAAKLGIVQADLDDIQAKQATGGLSAAQVAAALADELIAAGGNRLTADDHAAIAADLETAVSRLRLTTAG